MFALDFVWAYYTKSIQDNAIMMAGITAMLILLLNSAVTLSYVDDQWAIIPAALGAFLGTISAMKLHGPSKS